MYEKELLVIAESYLSTYLLPMPISLVGLWNQIFFSSNLCFFVLLPFAYLFTESEGFPGSKKVGLKLGKIFKLKSSGHSGRVVTLSPPTSEAGVRFAARPLVGKLVVACRWSALYSTEPWRTVCTGFLCPSNYPSWYDLYSVESDLKRQINKQMNKLKSGNFNLVLIALGILRRYHEKQ